MSRCASEKERPECAERCPQPGLDLLKSLASPHSPTCDPDVMSAQDTFQAEAAGFMGLLRHGCVSIGFETTSFLYGKFEPCIHVGRGEL